MSESLFSCIESSVMLLFMSSVSSRNSALFKILSSSSPDNAIVSSSSESAKNPEFSSFCSGILTSASLDFKSAKSVLRFLISSFSKASSLAICCRISCSLSEISEGRLSACGYSSGSDVSCGSSEKSG